MEAPCTVKAVTNGSAAEESTEVVTYGTAREGNKAHARNRQLAMDGTNGKPVIANKNDVIQHYKQNGIKKLGAAYLLYTAENLFEAVAFDLVIQKPAGHKANKEDEELT